MSNEFEEIQERLANWQPETELNALTELTKQLDEIPEELLGKSTSDFTEPMRRYVGLMYERRELMYKLAQLYDEMGSGYYQTDGCLGTIDRDGNVRMRPDANASRVRTLSAETEVLILGQTETAHHDFTIWYLLEGQGWIWDDLVNITGDCTPPYIETPTYEIGQAVGIYNVTGDVDTAEFEKIVAFLLADNLILADRVKPWTMDELIRLKDAITELNGTHNIEITGTGWTLEDILAVPETIQNIQDQSGLTFQSGTWSLDDFIEVPSMIRELETYGVTLGGTAWEEEYGIVLDVGAWDIQEIRLIYRSVLSIADRVQQQFSTYAQPGIQDLRWGDSQAAFQSLFGELNITRSHGDDAKPNSGWYGWSQEFLTNYSSDGSYRDYPDILVYGQRVVLGGKALRQDRERYYLDYDGASSLGYAPMDLVAHEVMHRLNYRVDDPMNPLTLCLGQSVGVTTAIERLYHSEPYYKELPDGQLIEVSIDDPDALGPMGQNQGYTSAARSGNQAYELVTDAFMNWALGNFTPDKFGRFRRQQLDSLMNQIIQCLM